MMLKEELLKDTEVINAVFTRKSGLKQIRFDNRSMQTMSGNMKIADRMVNHE